jgi:hypothetical protein
MLAVTLENDAIQIGPRFAVSFQRTLRIPDDARPHPLPPGLGRLHVLSVEPDAEGVTDSRLKPRNLLVPMYQREALWLGFHGTPWKPNAVKVAIGGVNVLTGEPDDTVLRSAPQDYLVCPNQPWLDGVHAETGMIRQFVAAPLHSVGTITPSMDDRERASGIQITVFEPRPGRFPDTVPDRDTPAASQPCRSALKTQTIGLGAGSRVSNKVFPDPYGRDTWDTRTLGRVEVHIVNSQEFTELTGQCPPPTPVDLATYLGYGLPWFEWYEEQETRRTIAVNSPATHRNGAGGREHP